MDRARNYGNYGSALLITTCAMEAARDFAITNDGASPSEAVVVGAFVDKGGRADWWKTLSWDRRVFATNSGDLQRVVLICDLLPNRSLSDPVYVGLANGELRITTRGEARIGFSCPDSSKRMGVVSGWVPTQGSVSSRFKSP